MKEAFRIALLITFGFTLVFEPARLALNKLGQYVGGVGGIGGLTNQYDTGAGCLNQNIVRRNCVYSDFSAFRSRFFTIFARQQRPTFIVLCLDSSVG
jgi:hypothetical protein